MTIGYSRYPVLTSQSLDAGGSVNSNTVDIKGHLGGVALLKITNGATPPDPEATLRAEGSDDGSEWFTIDTVMGGSTTANQVTSAVKEIPPGIRFVRISGAGGTGQAVTIIGRIVVIMPG